VPALPAAGSDLRVALGCTARVGGRTLRLPLGAWVAPGGALLAGEAVPLAELPERFPADGEAVVRTARRYFESTSYQWGGLTPWGADCSGMVQAVYALHGAALPRDAWQQAGAGRDAGGDLAAHAPGDLLFFSDRDDARVTHVGLAGGGGAMCHVALGRGGWAVDDLGDDTDDAYARRLRAQFVGARRVLG
jgi:cell wall-associated NlpC family hydrolase